MAAPAVLSAYEGLGSITMCSCGVVTLTLGGVSLRMDVTAFTQLETMMREASEDLLTRARHLESTRSASSMTH
jgi:hypothetical protein